MNVTSCAESDGHRRNLSCSGNLNSGCVRGAPELFMNVAAPGIMYAYNLHTHKNSRMFAYYKGDSIELQLGLNCKHLISPTVLVVSILLPSPHSYCRSCGEVMTAVVTKCLNASRAKTKEKAMELIMMYIEIDKHEAVQEELMKGLENKQPKIVYACVQAFRNALE